MAVYTIPHGVPFLPALARGLEALVGGRLPGATILVPSKRSADALQTALSEAALQPESRPCILPIEDPAEGGSCLVGDAQAEAALPPLIPPIRRQLLLARLVQEWSQAGADDPISPGQAAGLSASLVRLIDQLQAERLDLSALADFAPDRFATHRRVTLDFLGVLREHWPRILAAEGTIEPVERQNLMLSSLERRLREATPAGAIVAAGFARAGAALGDLLATMARIDNGAVVLCGLDRTLDDATWSALGVTHPQYALRGLLRRIGAERHEVADWPAAITGAAQARAALLAEALRPAEATDRWAGAIDDLMPRARQAGEGLRHLACTDANEEATAIALMLRRAMETPGRKPALLTGDRGLARRVAAQLRRWGADVSDAAPRRLGEEPSALLLRLIAKAAAADFAPVPLLALLKHGHCRCGQPRDVFRSFVHRLERTVLRAPRPSPGLEGIGRALTLAGADPELIAWFDGVTQAIRPVAECMRADVADLNAFVESHAHTARALAAPASLGPAAEFLRAFAAAAECIGALDGRSYAELFEVLIGLEPLPAAEARTDQIAILGLADGHLHDADLVVLGGLNEGVWPAPLRADPWLNRPVRVALGLPAPEEGIGHDAYAFAQAACAPQAVLTRARRAEGAPTTPSRWLVRLEVLAKGLGIAGDLDPPEPWHGWAEALDRPAAVQPIAPPRPTPALAARPARLSAAEIGTLLRDPYAVYARRVLGLVPLDPIDADPGAAERGRIIHRALERFVREHADDWPLDAHDELVAAGRALFEDEAVAPAVAAFWWPRFLRLARWFVDAFEPDCRRDARPVALQCPGTWPIPMPTGRTLTLTATVDRIDLRRDGSLAVYDYTTAEPPSLDPDSTDFSPRLALEALVAAHGGFPGVPAGAVGRLGHVVLTGGEVAGALVTPRDPPEPVLERTEAGLLALLTRFEDAGMPYLAQPRPERARVGGAYDLLARVGEWGLAAEGAG